MALIICPQCGKKISDNAKKCIYCSYVLDDTEREREANAQESARIEQEQQALERKKLLAVEEAARLERKEKIEKHKNEYKSKIRKTYKLWVVLIIAIVIVLIVMGVKSQSKYEAVAGTYIINPSSDTASDIYEEYAGEREDLYDESSVQDFSFVLNGSKKVKDVICLNAEGELITASGKIDDYVVEDDIINFYIKVDNVPGAEVYMSIHPSSGYVFSVVSNSETDHEFYTLDFINEKVLNYNPVSIDDKNISYEDISADFDIIKKLFLDDEYIEEYAPDFALNDSHIYVAENLFGIPGHLCISNEDSYISFKWTPDDVGQHEKHIIYCISEYLGEYTAEDSVNGLAHYDWEYLYETGWYVSYYPDMGIWFEINKEKLSG